MTSCFSLRGLKPTPSRRKSGRKGEVRDRHARKSWKPVVGRNTRLALALADIRRQRFRFRVDDFGAWKVLPVASETGTRLAALQTKTAPSCGDDLQTTELPQQLATASK